MNVNYVASVDGLVFAYAETQQNYSANLIVNDKSFTVSYHQMGEIGRSSLVLPVSKGDTYRHANGSASDCIYFVPCKGGV